MIEFCNCPQMKPIDDMDPTERHVVRLYQRTSALSHVNEARKQMFAFGNRTIEERDVAQR